MARLVGICRENSKGENDHAFQKHQLPVFVEDMRTMVVEFEDPCAAYASVLSSTSSSNKLTLKQFREKVLSLKQDELRSALTVDCEHFNNMLLQLVPCVGCRRSVEKLYGDLSSMGHPAIYPLKITQNFALTVHPPYFSDVKQLYNLLISDGQKMRFAIENLTKCRKNNKRCQLHSLDIHMCRTKVSWEELWDLMSEDCRDECCVIEADSLLDMLETYLEKHRFCTDCRAKVMKAYNLLIDEGDKSQEKGYNPLVYQGLRYCPTEQHLHLKPSVQYLNALIDRAEPEIMSGRERHAKTLDIAQGEVLSCLGLYLYDRLHRLVMALKTLQATFQLLYCTGIIALHTNFQETLERKHGLSDSLERLCAELQNSAANPSSMKHHPSQNKSITNSVNGHNGAVGNGKKSKKKPAKSASASSVSAPKLVLSKDEDCPNCIRRKATVIADTAICTRHSTQRLSPSPNRFSISNQRSYSLPRTPSVVADVSVTSTHLSSSDVFSRVENSGQGHFNNGHGNCVKCTITKQTQRNDNGAVNCTGDDDECSSGSSCCHDPGYCSQELSPSGGSPASGSCRLINKSPKSLSEQLAEFSRRDCLPEVPSFIEHMNGNKDGLCDGDGDDDDGNANGAELQPHVDNLFAGHGDSCSCTLLDMLEHEDKENTLSDDPLISPEDVKWFQENQTFVSNKRRALRERLLRQFHDMQERMQARQAAP